jgi:hypothetical protein
VVSFSYRGFYDLPRAILLRHRDVVFFLESAFEDMMDDYSEEYDVYRIDDASDKLLEELWEDLDRLAPRSIGRIKVNQVAFDATKRPSLDASILDPLLT